MIPVSMAYQLTPEDRAAVDLKRTFLPSVHHATYTCGTHTIVVCWESAFWCTARVRRTEYVTSDYAAIMLRLKLMYKPLR